MFNSPKVWIWLSIILELWFTPTWALNTSLCNNLAPWKSTVNYILNWTSPDYLNKDQKIWIQYHDTAWSTPVNNGSTIPKTGSIWKAEFICGMLDTQNVAWSQNINSSNTASSSMQSSSSSVQTIQTGVTWTNDVYQNKRCDLDGKISNKLRECVDFQSLNHAKMTVPSNVTRISQNILTLCNLPSPTEYIPLTAVYVWDNSGSMVTNDPQKITSQALKQALVLQDSLDQYAQTGFIKFSDQVIEEIFPVSLGLGQNLALLQTWLDFNPNGGTNYTAPLKKANAWLKQDRFKNTRRVIFFITDGLPSDSAEILNALDQESFFEIHPIFLNQDSTSLKQGQNFLEKIAQKTKTLEGQSPQVWPIKQAQDLQPILKQLVTEMTQSQVPVGLILKNESTNQEVLAQGKNFLKQDSLSWNIQLDSSLALKKGQNLFTLKGDYTDSSGVQSIQSIEFEIWVDSSVHNSNLDIENTPFATTCYESNSLVFKNSKQEIIQKINQKDSLFIVEFKTKNDFGLGDMVSVQMKSIFGDTLNLQLSKSKSDSIGTYYSATLPVKWLFENKDEKAILNLYAIDSLYIKWTHPKDNQDFTTGFYPVRLQGPYLKNAVAYDVNHDGFLDQMCFYFGENVPEDVFKKGKITWSYPIQNQWVNFTLDSLGQYLQNQEGWCWKPSIFLDFGTGLSAKSESLFYVNSQFENTAQGQKVTVLDSMAPRLDTAKIIYKNKEKNLAELQLFFSEKIMADSISINPIFDFYFQDKKLTQKSLNQAKWSGSTLKIPLDYNQNQEFIIFPNDSVVPLSKLHGIQDLKGNWVSADHPFVPVWGDFPLHFDYTAFVEMKTEKSMNSQNPTLNLTPLGDKGKGLEQLKLNGTAGFEMGQIRRDSLYLASSTVFPYQIEIYDHLGQFVTESIGAIDCLNEVYKEKCHSESGLNLLVEWNGNDRNQHPVGSGVYIWKLRFLDQVKLFKIGLKRN